MDPKKRKKENTERKLATHTNVLTTILPSGNMRGNVQAE